MRCYPSARQRRVLGGLFGASYWAWNRVLARRTSAYPADQARLNCVSHSRELTAWRQAPETRWLGELPRDPCNQVLRYQEAGSKYSATGAVGGSLLRRMKK